MQHRRAQGACRAVLLGDGILGALTRDAPNRLVSEGLRACGATGLRVRL